MVYKAKISHACPVFLRNIAIFVLNDFAYIITVNCMYYE